MIEINQAVKDTSNIDTIFKSYRKDGSPFWNHMKTANLRDAAGKAILIISIHTEVGNAFNA